MSVTHDDATVIYEDNQSVMALAKNVATQDRTKHIDMPFYYICEKLISNEVKLLYVESKN